MRCRWSRGIYISGSCERPSNTLDYVGEDLVISHCRARHVVCHLLPGRWSASRSDEPHGIGRGSPGALRVAWQLLSVVAVCVADAALMGATLHAHSQGLFCSDAPRLSLLVWSSFVSSLWHICSFMTAWKSRRHSKQSAVHVPPRTSRQRTIYCGLLSN